MANGPLDGTKAQPQPEFCQSLHKKKLYAISINRTTRPKPYAVAVRHRRGRLRSFGFAICSTTELERPLPSWATALDDFAAVGVHEYKRVRLKIPQEDELWLYFRGRRENPPFVWLEFSTDVRRR